MTRAVIRAACDAYPALTPDEVMISDASLLGLIGADRWLGVAR